MKRRRLLPIAMAAGLAAGTAMAEPWTCSFTLECEAGGACHEGGFGARVTLSASGVPTLATVTGASPLSRLTPEGRLPASYGGAALDGVAELLTIEADRSAILTLHIFDAASAAITYFGTCEGLS